MAKIKQLPEGEKGTLIEKVLTEEASGKPITEIAKRHKISKATVFNWRNKYGKSFQQRAEQQHNQPPLPTPDVPRHERNSTQQPSSNGIELYKLQDTPLPFRAEFAERVFPLITKAQVGQSFVIPNEQAYSEDMATLLVNYAVEGAFFILPVDDKVVRIFRVK